MTRAKKFDNLAKKLITKFDERTVKVQLIRQGEKTYNKTTAEYEYAASQNIDIDCVKTDDKNAMFANSTINNGDILLIATSKVKPLMNDELLSDGKTYSIIDVKTSAYTGDGLAIVYGIHAQG